MSRAHSVTVGCKIPQSFVVDQVRGMFDIEPEKTAQETFAVELPELTEDWQIGVIVGPSGSGKTTIARDVYGKAFREGGFRWDKARAVVDQFGKTSIKTVTQTLNAVGFSSPPAWLKPHHVLSGGERFRCDLARALLTGGEVVAFDEFTSVVDRTVAKIGSAAIAKGIRKERFGVGKRFVAVTCHYDVLDWLEPDWVLDMASGQLARGCLHRRPPIDLEIAKVHRGAWGLFRRHHYLSGSLPSGAWLFAAFWGAEPVGLSVWAHRMTRTRQTHDMRESRVVVLPDFQGIGIGGRLSALCASMWCGAGGRAFATASHPSVIHQRHKSPLWKTIRAGMVAPTGRSGMLSSARRGKRSIAAVALNRLEKTGVRSDSHGRITAGFQFIGQPMDSALAESIVNATPGLFGDPEAARVLAVMAEGQCYTKKAIIRRAKVNRKSAERLLRQLTATGEIVRHKIGHRVGYSISQGG